MKKKIYQGFIRVHPRGFGFVEVDNLEEDIFVPSQLKESAADGDFVEVQIISELSPKGPEGKVTKILKRARTHITASVLQKIKGGYLLFTTLFSPYKQVIVKTPKHLNWGDRLFLKVEEWQNKKEQVICSLDKVLGNIKDPSCDISVIEKEFQLSEAFPSQVMQEAQKFLDRITKQDKLHRTNLSSLPTITIDPETAKDFDDALSLEISPKGHFSLSVHIADVAHYIKANSPLDKEAYLRANSTYFPGKVIPMIPHELSSHLCSLKPDVERLCVTISMEFDQEGTLIDYKIFRSVIQSKKRFSYQEAFAVLEGKESPFSPLLKNMATLALLLKKKRSERGSIDFSLPDAVIKVDSQGDPQKIEIHEYDLSHQLVEEFMLKANEMIATHLKKKEKMLIYRIHEKPSLENFENFFTLARFLGFPLPPNPTIRDLQKLFLKAKDTPFAKELSVNFIRSMKLAYYSPDNLGHYGLALENYCHFTSPIRRYTDLIAQRLLFDEEGAIDLYKIAQHCSIKERISFKAESTVVILKKLRLLEKQISQEPEKKYSAIITQVKPFGIIFQISELFLDGFLHVSELTNDFFEFNEDRYCLVGVRTGKKFSFGDKISVHPTKIDLITQETNWELARSFQPHPFQKREKSFFPKKKNHEKKHKSS